MGRLSRRSSAVIVWSAERTIRSDRLPLNGSAAERVTRRLNSASDRNGRRIDPVNRYAHVKRRMRIDELDGESVRSNYLARGFDHQLLRHEVGAGWERVSDWTGAENEEAVRDHPGFPFRRGQQAPEVALGMFWTVCGANAIIALRCCRLSSRFEDYWEARSPAA